MCLHYLKEHMLEVCQTFACVSNLPKKPTIGNKIKPIGFQKVGPKIGQLVVIGFEGLIMRFGMRKC